MINECHPEQLVIDGKYLTSSALTELINALVQASTNIVAQSEAIKRGQPTSKINEQVFFLSNSLYHVQVRCSYLQAVDLPR